MQERDDRLTIDIDNREIERIAAEVQKFYAAENGSEYPKWAVSRAVRSWLVKRADSFVDKAAEMLTTPGREEARELKQLLNESLDSVSILENPGVFEGEPTAETNLFTGFRSFSQERLGAMAMYIAEKGSEVYKTKLNKLLFYSDFINFYLHGRSISGAKYIHVPFGPVPEQYGTVLQKLSEAGRVKLLPAGRRSVLIKPTKETNLKALEPEEVATIDWVLENYGGMSASQISEQSHREKAYRFTRPGEEIAYRYAAFFETLPDVK